MIDKATAQRIKDTADIVEVVSDYVHLIRRGSNFMGLCPFHNERTPSFSVNRRKNFCYCFSCKKGGSPVNFIMEKEGLTYHEALLHLAKKYGIEVVEKEMTDEERRRQSEREAMLVANEWAMRQMESDMRDTDEGRDVGLAYLTERGVTDEAMRAFHLGYAIDNGKHLVSAARKAGFNLDVFKTLGLIGVSQGGGREYDRFRGRVIFPILNTAGKTIAFGGRDLKGGLAKYINSPESDLYKKSNELYGIYQARSAIVRENKCYLVEGYMDVIGMWQAGMKNVVASSGTALTDGQIAMIHRFTDNITLIYDGDAAGVKASLRGIDMLLSHRLNVKVLLLPDNDDPDSFAKKHTPDEFQEYVKAHETDIIRYKASVMLADIKNDPQQRISAVNSVVESIAHIPDPVSRDVYVQECSEILGIPDTTIARSVARARAALVDKMRKEREWKALRQQGEISSPQPQYQAQQPQNRQGQQQPQTNQPGQQQPAYQPQQAPAAKPASTEPDRGQFYPLERQIVKYCVRYGYMQCILAMPPENEPGSPAPESIDDIYEDVVQFVRSELAADGLTFSYPLFNRILDLLDEMRPDFERYMQTEGAKLEAEIERRRREELDRLANEDLSMAQIEKAESKMEESLHVFREASLEELVRDFPGRQLASHEDDEIRNAALDLLREKHQLSNIYTKDGVYERVEDRLHKLVPRAVVEWKSELLNLQLKQLLQRFHEVAGKGNLEEERNLQMQLNALMKMRTEVARQIGERILQPNRR